MAETTPLGISVSGHATNIEGSVTLPGTREVLENMYNEFLDYKQVGTLPLDRTFEGYIAETLIVLKGHRLRDIKEKYWSGQMGKAEYDMLEEMRVKLVAVLERSDPKSWGFDSYGVQYIDPAQRASYRQKIGKNDELTPTRSGVQIKTSTGSGILRP